MVVLLGVLITLVAAVLGGIGVLYLGGCLIAYLSTHPIRLPFRRTPATFGAPFEEVHFPARDGVALSGWFVPAPSDSEQAGKVQGVVILCHGLIENRTRLMEWAEPVWAQGFALLLFDFRASGRSAGRLSTAGYYEPLDLLGAVDYVASRPDTAHLPIGVFGFSMGGATAILTAAEDPRIRAVATHGAFATLDQAIERRCRRHFGPFGPIVERVLRRVGIRRGWFPGSPSDVAPVRAVARLAPRPLLLLHGQRDPIVRFDNAHDLYAAAGEPKALHLLPRSGHRRIHPPLETAVRTQVAHFFRDHLAPLYVYSRPLYEQGAAPLTAFTPDRNRPRPLNTRGGQALLLLLCLTSALCACPSQRLQAQVSGVQVFRYSGIQVFGYSGVQETPTPNTPPSPIQNPKSKIQNPNVLRRLAVLPTLPPPLEQGAVRLEVKIGSTPSPPSPTPKPLPPPLKRSLPLTVSPSEPGWRCQAVQQRDGSIEVTVGRQDRGKAGRLALLRLRGLTAETGGWRITRTLTLETKTPPSGKEDPLLVDYTDLAGGGDWEVPLLLPAGGRYQVRCRPRLAPPLAISLSTPRYLWSAGENVPLDVTVRNLATTPQNADLQLTSTFPDLVPADKTRTPIGILQPGQSHRVRLLLVVPALTQEAPLCLLAQAGSDVRAALELRLTSELAATLETVRQDLLSPGERASFAIRLGNRGRLPQTVTIQVGERQPRQVLLAEGKEQTEAIEVTAPDTEPGTYPIEIALTGERSWRKTLRAWVGVPAFCRFTSHPPEFDGDLDEWNALEPMGMGRRDQVHSKTWRGPADLSGVAYVQWDATYLYFACAVRDDLFHQPFDGPDLVRADSVEIALSLDRATSPDRKGFGPADHAFVLALRGDTPILLRLAPAAQARSVAGGKIAIRRREGRILYEVALPWSALPPFQPQPNATLGFAIRINDSDGQGRGSITWGTGLGDTPQPGLFPPLRLIK